MVQSSNELRFTMAEVEHPDDMDPEQLLEEQHQASQAADEASTKYRRLASGGVLTLAVLAVVALAAWNANGKMAEGQVTEIQSLFMTCDMPKCEDKTRRRLDEISAQPQGLRALAEWVEWSEWNEWHDDQPKGPYSAKGKGTVCRQSPDDKSTDAWGTVKEEPGKHTVMECSKKCSAMEDGCKGFEYRKSEGRCELHVQDICTVEKQNPEWFPHHKDDFECFQKCED